MSLELKIIRKTELESLLQKHINMSWWQRTYIRRNCAGWIRTHTEYKAQKNGCLINAFEFIGPAKDNAASEDLFVYVYIKDLYGSHEDLAEEDQVFMDEIESRLSEEALENAVVTEDENDINIIADNISEEIAFRFPDIVFPYYIVSTAERTEVFLSETHGLCRLPAWVLSDADWEIRQLANEYSFIRELELNNKEIVDLVEKYNKQFVDGEVRIVPLYNTKTDLKGVFIYTRFNWDDLVEQYGKQYVDTAVTKEEADMAFFDLHPDRYCNRAAAYFILECAAKLRNVFADDYFTVSLIEGFDEDKKSVELALGVFIPETYSI